MKSYLNLAAVRLCTESEGPGKRFALWVQGCKQRCPDCCNQQMQEFKKAHIVEADDLIHLIHKSKGDFDIEGVSFIGGEPLLQAEGLSFVAEWCRKNNLSVLVFTGFLYETLLKTDDLFVKKLLANTDILVDGLYDKNHPDLERDWVGSKNQKVVFLSDRYKNGIEYEKKERSMELLISEKEILSNGWPFI
ncbi:4Fe-4S single cluster domain-containing protein [Treponema sp.]|uniref:4Fe-4S single cluster domain-containing protein n=1 Tax=Treponema sp. TaxID=166 RepID=UPI0025F46533|nr:4Fe-4S single cluster domain-containing protein [Treponema sp.]MBR4322611.1 radical SAM protein [Treponema sp.]